MKSTVKKLKNCKKIFEVKIPPAKLKDEFDRVYEDIKKVASVPGYRVGKAPRDLLELHYAKTAKEEVIKNLIPESYSKILEEYKLQPLGYPAITDVKMDFKEGFSYIATIETKPEFSLKNYKGLKLKKKPVEVKDEDVNKNLETLREMNAQNVPKKDSEETEKILPKLDDDFAKDLGFENLERLKDANMRLAYIGAIQEKQSPDKKFTLTDKDKKELEENAEKQAVRQVKVFFILDKIAQVEKIYLKEEDLEKRIEEMAAQYKKTKEEIRKHLEKDRMLDEMAVNMRNAKVMEFLLKEAKVI
jgi:trigger factor